MTKLARLEYTARGYALVLPDFHISPKMKSGETCATIGRFGDAASWLTQGCALQLRTQDTDETLEVVMRHRPGMVVVYPDVRVIGIAQGERSVFLDREQQDALIARCGVTPKDFFDFFRERCRRKKSPRFARGLLYQWSLA